METCRHGHRTEDRTEDRGQDRGRRSDMEKCGHGDFRTGQAEGRQTEDGGQIWRHVDMDRGTGDRTEDRGQDRGHGDMETCIHGQRTGDRTEGRGQDRGQRLDMETCRHGQRTGVRTEDGGQTWRHVDMDIGQGTG